MYKRLNYKLIFLLLAVAIIGLHYVFQPPEPPSTREIEQHIFNFTNQERITQGLIELEWNYRLAEIAREHSIDMVKNSFYDHMNKEGQNPTARAIKHNHPLWKGIGDGVYRLGIAENIAMFSTRVHGNSDAESIARTLFDGWMGSERHRENILRKDYDRIGIGVAYDGEIYYLATQNFW